MIFVIGPAWFVILVVVIALLANKQQQRRPVNRWDYLKAVGVVLAAIGSVCAPLLTIGSEPLAPVGLAIAALLTSATAGLSLAIYGARRAKAEYEEETARTSTIHLSPRKKRQQRDPAIGAWKDNA